MAGLGAPLMAARFPRAYLDLNREPYELDSRMFDGRLPAFANTRSMRVAGGLGTIPRIVADGQEIYPARLPVDEALRRIEWLYKPYHRMLRQLVQAHGADFRPRHPDRLPFDALEQREPGRRRKADIVLGDRYGTSCAGILTDLVEARLRGAAAIRSSATSPMRAASSPSITASRRSGAMRCRSRSTARSTWTSGRSRRSRLRRPCRGDLDEVFRRHARLGGEFAPAIGIAAE